MCSWALEANSCSCRYVALFVWSLAIWVSWHPLIDDRQTDDAGSRSARAIALGAKLLFAIYLCSMMLLFEKFSIQWIAGKFHERSYAGKPTRFEILIFLLTLTIQSVSTTRNSQSSRSLYFIAIPQIYQAELIP